MGTYPSQLTDKNIVIHGAPLAWCLGVRFDEAELAVKVANGNPASAMEDADDFRVLLSNIKKASGKVMMKGSSESGDYIDIEAADGAITRFPKNTRIVDGRDDTEVLTDPESDENATGRGEITIETNQGDLDHTSWTSFLKYLYTHRDDFWFLIIPLGFNYNKRYVADSKQADGYVYMLAKISSDLEFANETAPASLSITFVSYKFASSSSLYASSMANSAFADSDIDPVLRLMGTNPYVEVTAPTLTEDESEEIATGYPVFKEPS